MTSQTWGFDANPSKAMSNRPDWPPGVGNDANPSGPAVAGCVTTASTQSAHASAPELPPAARTRIASPAPSVVWDSRNASLARLPVLAVDAEIGGGAPDVRVWPPLTSENVTGWMARAATRARTATGDDGLAPATGSSKTSSPAPPIPTSGPSQSSPDPLPSRGMLVRSTS